MNPRNSKIYIADPGSSEMRVGFAGETIPIFRKATDKTKKRVTSEEPSTEIFPNQDPFMEEEFTDFFKSIIKDLSASVIILEKNSK